jgi:rhamnosyltransferase
MNAISPSEEGAPPAGVTAVLVSFNPDLQDELLPALQALRPQVQHVVVVDNGSAHQAAIAQTLAPMAHVTLIALPENLGIAAATNRGCEHALAAGATHVLLCDDDSVPAPDMVQRLQQALADPASHQPVACVGPSHHDPRTGMHMPFPAPLAWRQKWLAEACGTVVEVDHVIASGCLIPSLAWKMVGPLREDLFIDMVDIEWCLRARALGMCCMGSFAARMAHTIGDDPLRVRGRAYAIHTPLRHYYWMRNCVWLWRQPHAPASWVFADGLRALRRLMLYALFARPRGQHVRLMLLGLWHGITGRMGRLDL